MQEQERKLFNQLKEKIVVVMQQSFPGINPRIEDWKGQEIVDFQEELLQKVNAHLSEKWFYTHIKSDYKTLARIDVLNLLSKYVGYKNWDDFIFHHTEINEVIPKEIDSKSNAKANRYFLIVPGIVLLVMGFFISLFMTINTRDYVFRFYDADTKEIIKNCQIEVTVINENESFQKYLADTLGNVLIKTDKSKVRMIIQSPYYQTDTLERIVKKFNREEKVSLQPNQYALLLKYFSEVNITDWQKRKEGLNTMIDDRALIYQVYSVSNSRSIQVLNKSEFIDKMLVPSSSLQYFDVLQTKTLNNRVILLKYRIIDQSR